MKNQDILGVDVGNVIIDGERNDGADTSFFGTRYLETTPVTGAFEALGGLVVPRFGGRAFTVSKCGASVEEKTRRWFDHHRFSERTDIPENHFNFCRSREDKAPICRDLGITHFIDDKLEVLSYLVGVVPNLYLFRPKETEVVRFAKFFRYVTVVQGWQDVLGQLLPPQS